MYKGHWIWDIEEETVKNMDTVQSYDAIIVVTPSDYRRLEGNYSRLLSNMPARRVLYVGNEEVHSLVEAIGNNNKAGFADENDILPFACVHDIMKCALKDILNGRELPRGVTGWYYQQFLKMQYSFICQDAYYLVWDGDTIPCKPFSMFPGDGSGVPYLDLKQEYHEEYFRVMSKLIPGMGKSIKKSFISEHMLINCDIMKDLIHEIESNHAIPGEFYWEKIINAIDVDKLQSNSFSEFETYGTYVTRRYPQAYHFRDWHSFRYGGLYFNPGTISDRDFAWLGRDFYAISFEKGHVVREDHQNLFDNPKYQEKLSARRMLEIAQEEAEEGYLEVWD